MDKHHAARMLFSAFMRCALTVGTNMAVDAPWTNTTPSTFVKVVLFFAFFFFRWVTGLHQFIIMVAGLHSVGTGAHIVSNTFLLCCCGTWAPGTSVTTSTCLEPSPQAERVARERQSDHQRAARFFWVSEAQSDSSRSEEPAFRPGASQTSS